MNHDFANNNVTNENKKLNHRAKHNYLLAN